MSTIIGILHFAESSVLHELRLLSARHPAQLSRRPGPSTTMSADLRPVQCSCSLLSQRQFRRRTVIVPES